jgi:hypothetical protein
MGAVDAGVIIVAHGQRWCRRRWRRRRWFSGKDVVIIVNAEVRISLVNLLFRSRGRTVITIIAIIAIDVCNAESGSFLSGGFKGSCSVTLLARLFPLFPLQSLRSLRIHPMTYITSLKHIHTVQKYKTHPDRHKCFFSYFLNLL